MAGQRAGSAKVPAGPWSLATAQAFDQMMKAKGVTREQMAARTGISDGRVSKLLNGGRAWYLEDVARFCTALGLAFLPFLRGLRLEATPQEPADLATRRRKRVSDPPPSVATDDAAAALEPGREHGTDPGSGYDSV